MVHIFSFDLEYCSLILALYRAMTFKMSSVGSGLKVPGYIAASDHQALRYEGARTSQ